MTVRQRILAIRLLEKQRRVPAYAKQIGVSVRMKKGPGRKGEKE